MLQAPYGSLWIELIGCIVPLHPSVTAYDVGVKARTGYIIGIAYGHRRVAASMVEM
jgi:hypothetical protein